MIFGLLRLGKLEINWETLSQVNGFWLFLGFVTFYISIVARGLRWQHILKTMGWPVGFVYSQTLLTAGLFLSAVLPARAGDIGRVAMLKRDYHIPLSQGIASLAAERARCFFVLSASSCDLAFQVASRQPDDDWHDVLFIIGLAALFAYPALRMAACLQSGDRAFLFGHSTKMVTFGFP
jgi:uncharacterized protein (TIRG00374 family)